MSVYIKYNTSSIRSVIKSNEIICNLVKMQYYSHHMNNRSNKKRKRMILKKLRKLKKVINLKEKIDFARSPACSLSQLIYRLAISELE